MKIPYTSKEIEVIDFIKANFPLRPVKGETPDEQEVSTWPEGLWTFLYSNAKDDPRVQLSRLRSWLSKSTSSIL